MCKRECVYMFVCLRVCVQECECVCVSCGVCMCVCDACERERVCMKKRHLLQLKKDSYGVATISRILKMLGLFCKRAL